MISFKNVSVRAGNALLVKNVSFDAADGELTFLLGENGSGKTTLLRAACGTLPYRGSVLLDGAECRTLRPRERACRVSHMLQRLPAADMTVEELVCQGRTPRLGPFGRMSEEDRVFCRELLRRLELEALAERSVRLLSGGEARRACFAMLLAQDTKNVLLDEPAAHLDARHVQELLSFLRVLRDEGKCVVCVLHDHTAALRAADRIRVLREGALFFGGTPEEFLEEKIPERCFGERVWQTENGTVLY